MTRTALIVADSVCAGYGSDALRVDVLRGASFEIHRGASVAIAGPSGSGKTTLLSLVGGLDRPSSGRLLVMGVEIGSLSRTGLSRYRREQVGFVFQFFNLLPTLTAFENVELGLAPLGWARQRRRRIAADALARVGLAKHGGRLPHELSGGEQQRVAVARAWAKDPPLLLADEPTGNLDEEAGAAVLDLLLGRDGAAVGRTVLVATHDPTVAARTSRVLRLEAHGVVES